MFRVLFLIVAVIGQEPPGGIVPAEVVVEPGKTVEMLVSAAPRERRGSLLVSVKQPGSLARGSSIHVTARVGRETLRKTLHLGDPDVLWSLSVPRDEPIRMQIEAVGGSADCLARFHERAKEDAHGVSFETEPNDSPETANVFSLGRTIYGLADDRPYLPAGDVPTEEESSAGRDWFRFEVADGPPRLVYFSLEFVDRDIPPDVRVYSLKDGKPVEFLEGIDPQASQREKPPRVGANKFTTRVLRPGTYYVMVDACQPEYQLRTKVIDPPPYLSGDGDASDAGKVATAAKRAVRAAMDFQLLAGDSWHANTPRKGHPLDRVGNPHHETSTCIACHPTHFTTQSALAAVKSGYGIEQPFAFQFLTERLANNPVPFPGHEGAVWARMIPAPANVLGRLSTILMDAEENVTGAKHDALHGEIAEFLRLYYQGRTELPPDESNGNNAVSRYKVASDAWRQLDGVTGRANGDRVRELRDLVGSLIPTGEPSNIRDLAARLIGLCQSGHVKDSPEVKRDVERLLALQLPSGHWPYKLKGDRADLQMQTGESLYALSLAGLSTDHPAIRNGVVALLTLQKPFGGWLDLNPYEQFRTPFRETQWSLMALATVYPGPGTKGWNHPLGLPPERLSTSAESLEIAELEKFWDPPRPGLIREIEAKTKSRDPLVRMAACSALGRVGTTASLEALFACLGDESKVVQRAAAEGIRRLGSRKVGADDAESVEARRAFVREFSSALRTSGDRARRGATRIFACHFREFAYSSELAALLCDHLSDTDPIVRMQSAKALWRFWYWNEKSRELIEGNLMGALGEADHPWVRRNLIEALYIINDENIRYFDNQWVPSLARKEDRDKATAALHATINRLGEKFVDVLNNGKPHAREGVLRAMSEFPERTVLAGRVGNDTEPILYYGETRERVAKALCNLLEDADPTIRRLALQALVTIRGLASQEVALAVLQRRGDTDATVREWAETMGSEKLFAVSTKDVSQDEKLLDVVGKIVYPKEPSRPEALVAALDILVRLGAKRAEGYEVAIDRILSDPKSAPMVKAAAIRAYPAFPSIANNVNAEVALVEAMKGSDASVRIATIRLALDDSKGHPELPLKAALADKTPVHRLALLNLIEADKKKTQDLRLVGVVADALIEDDKGVREKALQLVQSAPAFVANPAIEESLRELSRSDNARQKSIAVALLKTRGKSSATDSDESRLDLAYFEQKVLPIFAAKGEDGQSCLGCHRSHTILAMLPPSKDGRWESDVLRANYRAALRVVNPSNPAESLLVRKPTWEAADEAEAQKDPSKKAHAGGVRFEPGSPEHQTLLDWINGARLKVAGP